jgi:lipoic acid synthetase
MIRDHRWPGGCHNFQLRWDELMALQSKTDCNHNTETIARLYRRVRPDAIYEQSMELLTRAAHWRDTVQPAMLTKSGIMAGLGETFDEVVDLMRDLRTASCDIMTIGQYLQPYEKRLPVERYVTPEEFSEWKKIGEAMGFKHVESSPLSRSSYHARQQTESGADGGVSTI